MSDHHAASAATRDGMRTLLRRRRDALSPDEQRLAARRVAERIREWAPWGTATSIGVYRSVGGELDPSLAASEARARGAATFVPVLDGDVLRFATFDDSTSWRPNRYGIGEPSDAPTVDVTALDLLLLPAVAVDRAGNRLGMGAGWYDRTLATVSPRSAGGPILVACVHSLQVVDEIRAQEWDVPVDAVVTPDGVETMA